jgi:hypothetical protein
MIAHASIARPPRVAAWLVELFASDEQAESIPGDLLEEFSGLALKSGVASARRWYLRQSVKTIAHLIATGFRAAPWSIAGAIIGGYLLLGFGVWIPKRVIVAVLNFSRHGVVPYYTWPQMQFHLLWLNRAIMVGHFIVAMLVGCIVAMATRGREMVSTVTLILVRGLLAVVGYLGLLVRDWPVPFFVLPFLVSYFAGSSMAILIGGVIVRTRRSAPLRRALGA